MPEKGSKDRGISHSRYLLLLGLLFAVLWIALAIAPIDRKDWALENLLAVIMVVVLAVTAKNFPFSRISYTLIFLFLCLHEVGAHYTYAEVPYDRWCEAIFGRTFNSVMGWQRNHFDRLVHFLYGLLLAYPIREMFHRVAAVKGFWGYFLPLDVTMSTSMLFELFEWVAAEIFGGELGIAYLGTQGDIWDAHKDMALASLGAVIAMTVTACINLYLQRDFAQEWAESLRVKRKTPLGEVEIKRMLRDREQ
jgi:putative membrane protein